MNIVNNVNKSRHYVMAATVICAAAITYLSFDSSSDAPAAVRASSVMVRFEHEAPLTAATAKLPTAPDQALTIVRSYESARDLHQFFLSANASNDPAVVYQGYRAYFQCQALVSNASNLRAAFSGGDNADIPGVLTAERGAAAEEVLKRCRGFERMSERELNETGIALRGKLKQLGSIEASMDELDSPPIVDRATLNALLETHTASAFELAQQTLARMLREEIKVLADSDEARQIEVAVMLAACDMGKDCSASSYASLYQCAYYGNCQPVGHDWREGLSEPDINHVMELKKRVVERVNNRGFK